MRALARRSLANSLRILAFSSSSSTSSSPEAHVEFAVNSTRNASGSSPFELTRVFPPSVMPSGLSSSSSSTSSSPEALSPEGMTLGGNTRVSSNGLEPATINAIFRQLVSENQSDWASMLPHVEFAVNSTRNFSSSSSTSSSPEALSPEGMTLGGNTRVSSNGLEQ
jgi:hypothetical protein